MRVIKAPVVLRNEQLFAQGYQNTSIIDISGRCRWSRPLSAII